MQDSSVLLPNDNISLLSISSTNTNKVSRYQIDNKSNNYNSNMQEKEEDSLNYVSHLTDSIFINKNDNDESLQTMSYLPDISIKSVIDNIRSINDKNNNDNYDDININNFKDQNNNVKKYTVPLQFGIAYSLKLDDKGYINFLLLF
jgi:hypothetical protein